MPINKILAEYLDQYHKGEANAVTSRELEYAFGMRGSELRRAVNALRVERIPICSFEGGYYYAATSEEIRRTALQLQSRVNKIAAAARGMIGALPDYEDIPWSSNSSKNTRATLVTVLTELSAQLLCVVTCALNLSRIALC